MVKGSVTMSFCRGEKVQKQTGLTVTLTEFRQVQASAAVFQVT